jgi:hypothetical protein
MNVMNDPLNTAAISRLQEAVRVPLGIVPFVGAGLSITWGYSGWLLF